MCFIIKTILQILMYFIIKKKNIVNSNVFYNKKNQNNIVNSNVFYNKNNIVNSNVFIIKTKL
jgi:hypothetical protein